ncbi:MAG: branched-chain amino acid transport system substrate-binding protein, partial [Acidimicrobiaceae bacterium]|nr:branched-chain amino acid transport system substrate-binding protein [Acidimicrobiaceae bacterium]
MGSIDQPRSGRPAMRRRVTVLLVSCALAASASGCGSRRAESDLLAAAATRTGPGAQAAAAGAVQTTLPGFATSARTGESPAGEPAGVGATGGSDTGQATGGSDTGQPQPIKVGNIGIYSGVGGAVTRNGLSALKAWEQSVNAQGGVAGHPVQVVVADDGGDPAQSLA